MTLRKGSRFLQRTLFVSKEASARTEQYYRLLHTEERVRLKNDMHVETRSTLHRFDDKLSTDRRAHAIAAILDRILL